MKALFLALGLLVSSIANADYYGYQTDYYPRPSASFTIPLNDSGASFSFSTNSYYQPPVYYAPQPVIIYRQPPQHYYRGGNGYHREWRHNGYYNHGHRHHGHHHDD